MTEILAETSPVPQMKEDRLERERLFFSLLAKQDKGRLAVLRRNAGNSLADAKGPVAWFHGLSQRYSGEYGEETCFLIATLFASDKDAIEGKNRFKGNLGATLHALRQQSGVSQSESSPLDNRFNTLLDADFNPENGGELAFRLRQMTKRIISAKDRFIRIDWPQLLHDIQLWNHEKKYTQKYWARSYYAPSLNSLESSDTDTPENQKTEEI